MLIELANIRNDFEGFSFLSELAQKLVSMRGASIELDMRRVSWFEANMCSPVGAILYLAGRSLNNVTFINFNEAVEKILRRNDFLSHYGWPLCS